jgi:uncharacterized protein YjbI with pentapeptide repeats
MNRLRALCLIFAVFSMVPTASQAFNEIDQIGTNNFKPMKGCPNCHLRRVGSDGAIRWIGAKLPKTVLINANLNNADMRGANLRAADLRHADLRDANISGANLRKADLSGADLSGANLYKADLTDANFHSESGLARLCKTVMPDGSVDNSGCDTPDAAIRPHALTSGKTTKTDIQRGLSILGITINLP